MAQRVHVVLEDDLDGSGADETVTFGIDGTSYEIDLTSKNATKLRDALAPYVASGRRLGRSTSRRTGARRSTGSAGAGPADIRDWGRANGFQVSERGRVSAEVRAAYEAAH